MKRIVTLCVIIAFAASSLSAQAAEKREHTYVVGANVDAQGNVSATQIDPDVPASIAAVLASAVKQWRFTPATRDGQPVPAHTFISTKLQALPGSGGQYQLRISFAGNGPKLDRHAAMPDYPREAARARQMAFTVLEATVQPNGSLTDMRVNSRFENWRFPPSFKTAVLAAAKHWHATPEQVDGIPVATRLNIPVNFTLDPPTLTASQIRILRKATRAEAAEDARPGIPLPSEQMVALDSPLQPRSVASVISAP